MATAASASVPAAVKSAPYAPTIGSFLTVSFPGERMRCRVDRLVDKDRVIIEVSSVPISKAHQYRIGDKTGARRRREHGHDIWEALDDRDFLANRSPAEPLPPEPPAVKKAAPKKRVAAKKVRKK